MKQCRRSLIILLCAIGGCATNRPPLPFETIAEGAKKVRSQSSMDDVRSSLGEPNEKMEKGSSEVWSYLNPHDQLDTLTVSFKNGKCTGVILNYKGEALIRDFRGTTDAPNVP